MQSKPKQYIARTPHTPQKVRKALLGLGSLRVKHSWKG
jgi:hypothetical protein